MTLSFLNAVGLVANFTALTITVAIVLLVLWQSTGRDNILLALFMSAAAVNSLALMALRVPDLFTADLLFWGQVAATATASYVVLAFVFVALVTQYEASWLRGVTIAAGVAWVTAAGLIWSGNFLREITLTPAGVSEVTYTGWAVPLMLVMVFYLGAVQYILMTDSSPHSDRLFTPFLILAFATLSNVIAPFSRLPIFAVLVVMAVFLLGQAVMRGQILNPLAAQKAALQTANAELQRANELKTQFMATISHELRTPLNSIIGFTQLVLDGVYGDLNPKQRDRIATVMHSAQNLLILINDILDLTRIDEGRLPLQPERIDVNEVVGQVVNIYSDQAAGKDIYLYHNVPENMPPLMLDRARLRQILSHLVSNGVKFTKRGGVMIDVRLDAARELVIIDVTDTGVGMPREVVHSMFDSFRQGDGTLTRPFEGVGIGLTMVERLVAMQGGQVKVESEPGLGSRFTVSLPVSPAPMEELDGC